MDTRSPIWHLCPAWIVNKEFGNDQAVPEIKTPRHLSGPFRIWDLYKRWHLNRSHWIPGQFCAETQDNMAEMHKFVELYNGNVACRLKCSAYTEAISSLYIYLCTHAQGLDYFMAWKSWKNKSTRCKKGKRRGLRKRKRIWRLSGNPLERGWKLILTKKKMQIACILMPLQRHTERSDSMQITADLDKKWGEEWVCVEMIPAKTRFTARDVTWVQPKRGMVDTVNLS